MKFMSNTEFKTWLSYLLLIICGIIANAAINNIPIIGAWLKMIFGYASPFFAGAVIAYLLGIPCDWIERKLKQPGRGFFAGHARGFATLITYACAVAVIVLTMRLLIPEIARSVMEFVANFQIYYQRATDFFNELTVNEDFIKTLGIEALIADLSIKNIIDSIGYGSIWQSLVGILNVSSFFLNFLIAVVSSVYMLLEARAIGAFFSKLTQVFIPKKEAGLIIKYLGESNSYFKKFLYCNTIDGLIIGAASVVGLMFIDVRYAVVLGIAEGVANMIPFFGAIIGSLVVASITLLTDGVAKAFVVLVFLFILQQIDGNIIKVKLFGDSFQISPFLVLFSITVGGAAYGVAGIVVAIPAVAVLKSIINDAIDYKLR